MYYAEIEQQHYVILVKRITADTVRKYSCPFESKQSAIDFMYSLYSTADAEKQITNKIADTLPTPSPQEEKTLVEDGTNVIKDNKQDVAARNKNFSFGDDDNVNLQPTKEEKPLQKAQKAKFEFADNAEIQEKKEMQRLKDMPIQTRETSISSSAKLSNGIF